MCVCLCLLVCVCVRVGSFAVGASLTPLRRVLTYISIRPNLTQPEIGLVRQLRLSQHNPNATPTVRRPRSLLPACHPRSLHVGVRGSRARFDAQHRREQDCYPREARYGEWRQASTRHKEEGRQ